MARTCGLALVGVILMSLFGCAGAPAATRADGLAPTRRDPTVITREELEAQDIVSLTAFAAIERLRPRWLNARGTTSVGGGNPFPAVLIGGVVQNDLAALRRLSVGDVESLSLVAARDATTRFGTGYVNGLIEVVLRTGRR
jgi:hypothetical protein